MKKETKLKLLVTVQIDEEPEQYYHIPGAPFKGDVTLCGWTDAPHVLHDALKHPVTCHQCLNIVEYCNRLTKEKE